MSGVAVSSQEARFPERSNERLKRVARKEGDNMDITTAARYIQSTIDEQWFGVWHQDIQRFESLYQIEGGNR
jgi:hypothetical protein